MVKKQDEISKKWYFENEDGSKIVSQFVQQDGKSYYVDKDGIVVTSWFKPSENLEQWYYAYPSDVTDDKNVAHVQGEIAIGWILDQGKYYYLYPENTEKYGHSYNKGEMATDWVQDEGFYYYLNPKHTEENGVTNLKGQMLTGWIQDNGAWYYLYPQRTTNYGITYPLGAMAVDWIKFEQKSKWYYLLRENTEYNGATHLKGECVCNATLTINGQSYTFDSNGVWQPNSTSRSSLISEKLAEFTGGFEGLSLKAYYDPYYGATVDKYWTIGYGTCKCAIPEAFPNGLNSTCTEEQALGWLMQEMNVVADTIKNALGDSYGKVSQQAFDCLCDIGYNAGTGDLIGGHTWNAIISGDEANIRKYVMSWCSANGSTSSGLYKRCVGRVQIVLNDDYSARP